MLLRAFAFALLAMLAVPTTAVTAPDTVEAHPEARPFDAEADAKADVNAALARAQAANKMVLLVMGANWCHDSRALAGWFAQPRFSAMIASRYELVYVDVGQRDRNIGVARRFGIKAIKGTPTVLILNSQGRLLNKKDAPSWRNAASRSEQEIYSAFAEFTPA